MEKFRRYTGCMALALLLAALAAAPGQSGSATTQADAKLVRVFIHTEDRGEPRELASRLESVKHLTAALGSKKNAFVMINEEDPADVVIDVRGRALTVPKVVIGIGARPGDPPGGAAMARVVQLSVSVDAQRLGDEEEFKNKNAPVESQMGWKSAADDIAKQIEKWIADRRLAIIAAR